MGVQSFRNVRHSNIWRRCAYLTLVVVNCASIPQVGAESLSSVPGVWQMQGYGEILEITSEAVVRYDLTNISCLRVEGTTTDEADLLYDRLVSSGDSFTFFETGGITRYEFLRLDHLPQRCGFMEGGVVRDPEYNFSVLWHAFGENYAFFELRGVDWDGVYHEFAPRIDSTTSESDLFDVFELMLGTLGDGHVQLNSPRRKFGGGSEGELRELWNSRNSENKRSADGASFRSALRQHVEKEILHGEYATAGNGNFVWGWAAPGIAYLNVYAMWLSAKHEKDLTLHEQLQIVDQAMARVVAQLGQASALIVDARFNLGGEDAVALQIMGYLASEAGVAFTKNTVHQAGFTEPQAVRYTPRGQAQYGGPVIFLQGGTTASAAEIFTLAMLARPETTRVGRPTYGVLSDELEKRLPNGWTVTMSNEVYRAVDGNVYEGTGIPPDHWVKARDDDTLANRLQRDYQAGLALARKIAQSSAVGTPPGSK
ncbi:MAG TPA: S41 family peptidase [Woeseiaceae bacterium]|nr:S41 family peptidase [Woeseiaceae bacterium]